VEFRNGLPWLTGKFGPLARVLSAGIVLFGLIGGPAAAQTASTADRSALEARKQALFARMLGNPNDLDATFAYADAAARLGDNEAAIGALERMLLFNPNLPRVELELGALYFRLGSFETARSYFEKGLAANPPPDVKARIETYLAQIVQQGSPEHFSGLLFFGAQYQSDANVAPGSSLINTLLLGPVTLQSQFVKREDVNVFGTATLLYSHDLGTQNGDAFEVTSTDFANHYFRFDRLDLGLAEVTAGPRFKFPAPAEGVANATLKPYFILNEVGLGEKQYFYTYGGGGEATAVIWDDLAVKADFEFRQKKFSNAPDRPLSTGFDGNDKLVAIQLTKPVTLLPPVGFLPNPQQRLGLEFDFLDQSTRLAFYSNKTYGIGASYLVRYDDPTGSFGFPWETTLSGGRIWSDYAAPDPCCNTSPNPATPGASSRLDRRWRFSISQLVEITPDIAIAAQYQRDIVSSNLPIYAYTSNSVLVGPQIRF